MQVTAPDINIRSLRRHAGRLFLDGGIRSLSLSGARKSVRAQAGFTIVELLVVIVVIGILTTLVIVAYNGIQQRAKIAVIQSDLEQGAKQLETYRFGTSTSEQYPADQATANLKASSGTTLNYQVNNSAVPPSYCLTAVNGSLNYRVSNTSTTPTVGTCTGVLASGASCPNGFIVVPGSTTFGTSEFCVMKYEAKQATATVPISQASGAPWVDISQTNAITYSANVVGCTGCRLISEAEWLTIAHNALNVSTNWSGGSVGNGYIYSGHSDGTPSGVLVADTNDSNSYSGTGNDTPSNQRRTLTLSNGEVIWDFAGNAFEWTNATLTGTQPGAAGWAYREYNNPGDSKGSISTAFPSFGTPAASGWTSVQGIGQYYSSTSDPNTFGFIRGGDRSAGSTSGVFALNLQHGPSITMPYLGFRVVK